MATESPLKMMKDAFYFTLKDVLVLKILKFLFWLFGHVKNGFIRKIRLITKFNRCNNLVVKQLQYTYWPISQEAKATRQWNLVRPFSKKSKLSIYLDQYSLKFYTVYFRCMPSRGLPNYIETNLPDDWRSICRNVALLNIIFHNVLTTLLYYEHWTDKRKHFYVYLLLLHIKLF